MSVENPAPKRERNGPRKPRKISERYLHNAGLAYLQRFSASKNHFRSVMKRKIKKSCMAHPEQNIDTCHEMLETLIEKFENVGLLDDDLYIKGRVQSLRRSGLSKKKIIIKLLEKGVSQDLTIKALNAYENDYNIEDGEYEAALKFARKKKLGPCSKYSENDFEDPADYRKQKDKELASLARAGFSYDVVRRVFEADIDDIVE